MTTEFRTIQKPLNYRGLINHRKRLMMIGSCFSDNIGQRLVNAFFDVNINPFGTLYNPASIARGISDILYIEFLPKKICFRQVRITDIIVSVIILIFLVVMQVKCLN